MVLKLNWPKTDPLPTSVPNSAAGVVSLSKNLLGESKRQVDKTGRQNEQLSATDRCNYALGHIVHVQIRQQNRMPVANNSVKSQSNHAVTTTRNNDRTKRLHLTMAWLLTRHFQPIQFCFVRFDSLRLTECGKLYCTVR